MSQENKYLLRSIVADLLAAYEDFSAHELSLQEFDRFILSLERSLHSYFFRVTLNKITSEHAEYQLNNPCYIASFSISDDDSSEKKSLLKNFTITYFNLKSALSLIGSLKKCIVDGYCNLIFVSERNIFKRTTFAVNNKETPETDAISMTFKIMQHIDAQSEIADSFFIDLVTAGAVDAFEDYSIATDFFSDSWEFFTDFVRSALINYHIAYCDLSSIHICKVCGKIFLPQKSGEFRGVFCSTECKNSHYKINNKVLTNCIQNQKNRLNTMATLCRSKESDDLLSSIILPSIENCRNCPAINSLGLESSVKAGKCPLLLNDKNFILLTQAYLKQKELEKTNKKKRKIGDNDEYDLLF